jgi:hypothetical protein
MIYVNIPYFGGSSSAAYSDKNNRLNYLFQTIAGLKTNISFLYKEDLNITLHVANSDDEKLLNKMFPEFKTINHSVNNPIFLASNCVDFIKNQYEDNDIILYTEADQVFCFENLENILKVLNDNNYIAPHRIEEIPSVNPRCHHPNNNEFLNINDRLYQVQNRSVFNGDIFEENKDFYKPCSWDLAFGGSFLIKGSALKKINISYSSNFPVEHASGIDAYNNLLCLKTNNFLNFYCTHLSGYEKNLNGSYRLNNQ